ncbi:LytS/YhcK type 5TM receptor domain-containing protein [Symbiopectobacterium sp.]|uniref:LytS/YhcK type 5TM receptor domain-containing protein n=1 Tax=Symbiopectobacterium sp. TaxID=2952789 RepID=UPI003F37E314
MCVYLVIAYLLSKTPLFIPLMQVTIRLPHKLVCYLVFSMFCIMGTYFGLHIDDSIANTRATGAVLGGMLGGPSVGFLVGLTGGLHRYSMGGMTALACMVSTITEGLIGGLLHRYLLRRNRIDMLFQPLVVGRTSLVAELLQMIIILLLARPFDSAVELVKDIALPMMITNTVGSAMFMRILLDRRAIFKKYTSAFSAKALQIAARAEGALRQGFDQQKQLLAQSEIKLLHAQVNPHFLFNAFNTPSAVIRRNPDHARQLVLSLSTFFRKNLKRSNDEVSLRDEMEHVNAYLEIEKARFADHMTVEITLPEELMDARLPAFSLQPIVENAIKHGISQMIESGHIHISGRYRANTLELTVEDNAGTYQPPTGGDGLGMNLVDRRIKARYGNRYGITVESEADTFTRVEVRVPLIQPKKALADIERAA